MVNIDLGDGWRIISDPHQFIVQKLAGGRWRCIYYHAEIEPLLHSVALRRTRVSKAKTLKELVDTYRKEKDALKVAISAQMGRIEDKDLKHD